MRPTAIRHLSIALEALARIQGTEGLYTRVYRLLEKEINLMEEDNRDTSRHPQQQLPDDEIPF